MRRDLLLAVLICVLVACRGSDEGSTSLSGIDAGGIQQPVSAPDPGGVVAPSTDAGAPVDAAPMDDGTVQDEGTGGDDAVSPTDAAPADEGVEPSDQGEDADADAEQPAVDPGPPPPCGGPCPRGTWCDLERDECVPGCVRDADCPRPGRCDLDTHECHCADRHHPCGDGCEPDDSPSSCGDRCTPCPTPDGGVGLCLGGACAILCGPGTHRCGETCASDGDPARCGAECETCPTRANASAVCVSGRCDLTCNEGFHACGERCVDRGQPAHCGTRCDPCRVPGNGAPTCVDGECGVTCHGGFHACADACVNDDDADRCGPDCVRCPTPERGEAVCAAGACAERCEDGRLACDGRCTRTNTPHACGAGCATCPAPAGATPFCDDGSCAWRCGAGASRCDGRCVDTSTDEDHCGGCAQACAGDEICSFGSCVPPCVSAWAPDHVAAVVATGVLPADVAAADFDDDGSVDLAVSGVDGGLAILLHRGGNDFAAPPVLPSGFGAGTLATGDVDDDGAVDVVVSLAGAGRVTVWRGAGDGTLHLPSSLQVGPDPGPVVLADISGDGNLDILIGESSAGALQLMVGFGDGTFDDPISFPIGDVATHLAAGDLDADGRADVAVRGANASHVRIFRAGAGGFLRRRADLDDHPYASVTMGGYPDEADTAVLAARADAGRMTVAKLINDPLTGVSTVETTTLELPAPGVYAAGHAAGLYTALIEPQEASVRVAGDSVPAGLRISGSGADILMTMVPGSAHGHLPRSLPGLADDGSYRFALSHPDGWLRILDFGGAPPEAEPGPWANPAEITRLRRTAEGDLLAVAPDASALIRSRVGATGLEAGQIVDRGARPTALATADLDGDGRSDVALADAGCDGECAAATGESVRAPEVRVLRSVDAGGYAVAEVLRLDDPAADVLLHDGDADGCPDLWIALPAGVGAGVGRVLWHRGTCDGEVREARTAVITPHPVRIIALPDGRAAFLGGDAPGAATRMGTLEVTTGGDLEVVDQALLDAPAHDIGVARAHPHVALVVAGVRGLERRGVDPDGALSSLPSLALPYGVYRLRIADVDADGREDAILLMGRARSSVGVAPSVAVAATSDVTAHPLPAPAHDLAIMDVDFDGRADVVSSLQDASVVHVLRGRCVTP